MTHSTLYVGNNSSTLIVDGLADEAGDYQADATVSVTAVATAAGAAVAGVAVPIPMSFVAASNGRYEASLSGLSFVAGVVYMITFRATSASGKELEAEERVIAKVRRA